MISPAHLAAYTLATVACGIAAGTDLSVRRVPNWLTLPLFVVAPLLAAFDGVHAALVAAGILIAAVIAGSIIHTAGILGGGDVKLLAGVSALAGFPACINVVLYAAICGGVLALVISASRGELGQVIGRLHIGITSTVASRSLAAGTAAIDARGARIPYALAIGAGFAIAMLAQNIIPALRILH